MIQIRGFNKLKEPEAKGGKSMKKQTLQFIYIH